MGGANGCIRGSGACAMKSDARRWHRLLWGVQFTRSRDDDAPMLIGGLWHDEARKFNGFYEGEPTRALLFCTRREARHWCTDTNRKWQATKDPIQQRWRVRPVRVRETVQIEARNSSSATP